MAGAFDFTTPPIDAIAYFQAKRSEVHFDYDEILHEAHNKAFTVAKITRLDLLSDIHSSLVDAMHKGQDFSAWKKNIQSTLETKGWWGKTQAINPLTGEVKEITVGSRRLRTIYDTNMRTSYAKGRYAAQMESDAEFLRYDAILDQHTRPTHSARNGIILPKEDPWWSKNYPPNGWKCRCKASSITRFEMKRRNLSPYEGTLPTISDKDWAYHVGKSDTTLKTYQDKVNALESKGFPQSFSDKAKEAYLSDVKTLQERTTTFKAIKELFTTQERTKVQLGETTLFGTKKRLLLSSDTVGSYGHHPEIGAFEYSLIPDMLEGRIFVQKETTDIIIKKLGKYYRVTLKDIPKTDEVYVVSLVRANQLKDFVQWIKELSKFEEVSR